MSILGDYLLYCKLSATFDVPAQPYQAKTSPPQQLDLLEAIRKTVAKGLFFLLSQTVTLSRLSIINLFLLLLNGLYSPLIFLFAGFSLPSSLCLVLVQLNFKVLAFFVFGSIVLLIPQADLIFINH